MTLGGDAGLPKDVGKRHTVDLEAVDLEQEEPPCPPPP